MTPEPEIPRTVRPRKLYEHHLPIISYSPDAVFIERTGELLVGKGISGIVSAILREPKSLVIAPDIPTLLADLDKVLADHPRWQYRVSPIKHNLYTGGGDVEVVTEDLAVKFFGFVEGKERRYFQPLDPSRFVAGWRDRNTTNLPTHQYLYEWAVEIRDFCKSLAIKPAATTGGVAAQLLTHGRFYPNPRRKIPTATNERMRPHLPGNHYQLYAETGTRFEAAWVIDQHAAHHQAAATVPLPDADHLLARGRWKEGQEPSVWLKGRRAKVFAQTHYGLLYARVHKPVSVRRARWPIPVAADDGENGWQFIYTNELEYLISLGCELECISAAWASSKADTGLPRYARYALEELSGGAAEWKKRVLLAPYGLLAARPRHMTNIYAKSDKGREMGFIAGARMVTGKGSTTSKEHAARICNVLQRGIIEAHVRLVSMKLAHELHTLKYNVLAVHADAVIIEHDERGLPLLDNPWRVKEELTGLQFIHSNAFVSREMVRLPGVPRQKRDEYLYQLRAAERALQKPVSDGPPMIGAIPIEKT